MTNHHRARRAPRTVLEQKIWESNQTFEEYAEYAEQVARDHHEPATLGVRHLERLAAGRRGDGRPLGPVRPATARLLQRLIPLPIAVILGPPKPEHDDEPEAELRQRLTTARRIDPALLKLFAEQLNAIRQLDRQLGAPAAYREITTKTEQLTQLHTHHPRPTRRITSRRLRTRRLDRTRPRRLPQLMGPPRERQNRSPRRQLTTTDRLRHRPTSRHPHRPRRH